MLVVDLETKPCMGGLILHIFFFLGRSVYKLSRCQRKGGFIKFSLELGQKGNKINLTVMNSGLGM
jgi:hypothetical protein